MFHFLKISDDLILVVSSISYISTIQNAAGTSTTAQVQLHKYNCTSTTAQPISSDLSCIIHSPNFSVFTPFSTLARPNLQLQLHSCHLQLQITFYNCRNCHQLHVKILVTVIVSQRRPSLWGNDAFPSVSDFLPVYEKFLRLRGKFFRFYLFPQHISFFSRQNF